AVCRTPIRGRIRSCSIPGRPTSEAAPAGRGTGRRRWSCCPAGGASWPAGCIRGTSGRGASPTGRSAATSPAASKPACASSRPTGCALPCKLYETQMSMKGRFGPYGGQYVPETLMSALEELEGAWNEARADPEFQLELKAQQHAFVGRPTPLYAAERLSEHFGGARIHLKREDLCHTGAHKLNNALGQALLARRMGKRRIIAETGAGQHGVATATVCARFGFSCTVDMGREDMRRQAVNVQRMRLLGAEVREVTAGTETLKDATSEAIRDWVTNVGETHYIIGSAVGPHPYPEMVRDLQRVIGD